MEAACRPWRHDRSSSGPRGAGRASRASRPGLSGEPAQEAGLIVLDASAAIDLVVARPTASMIAEDLASEAPTLMPAHFEADAYAGLRRMTTRGTLGRAVLPTALQRVSELQGERVPLAPLLPTAFRLFDHVGAHDSFYVALALARGATLLTSDAPLARAAEQLGVTVLLRQSR
jgi:predicted nucleic acid-binding protein